MEQCWDLGVGGGGTPAPAVLVETGKGGQDLQRKQRFGSADRQKAVTEISSLGFSRIQTLKQKHAFQPLLVSGSDCSSRL